MKVAIVYDRVNKWGGAERVLLALHEMFPDAPLFTSVYNPDTAAWASVFTQVIPSFLQRIPFARTHHEFFALLMPIAFESFDFSEYDLVVSVTSEAAKGIITTPFTKHICICLTPTRYLWSGYDEYFKGQTFKVLSKPFIRYLRNWDLIASKRPDVMIAISTEVHDRIKRYYDRDSQIIFPPVDSNKFEIPNSKYETNTKSKYLKTQNAFLIAHNKAYYLVVSRLVKYKRVDLAIEAFNALGLPLIIIGKGTEEMNLKTSAKSNITFVSDLTDQELISYYDGAKALIMPQFEDFGLVAVEAQMRGIPVIAYGEGGAKDTVLDGKTGILFPKQSALELKNAVKRFEMNNFDRKVIIQNALRFSKKRFKKELVNYIKTYV